MGYFKEAKLCNICEEKNDEGVAISIATGKEAFVCIRCVTGLTKSFLEYTTGEN